MRSYNPVRKGHGGQIKKAVQLLLGAKRPDDLHRRRRDPRRGLGRSCAELVRLLGYPCTNTLMGLGAYPAQRPAVPRHARHARHLRGQQGDAELRRAARRRRALRRPRDRQPGALRAGNRRARSSTSTSTRPRSPSACRSTCPIVGDVKDVLHEHARAAQGERAAARRRRARRVVEADRRVARQGLPALRPQQPAHQAAVRGREAVRAHQAATPSSPPTSASTRCGRRSSTTSTSRAAGSTPAAWAPWASACPYAMGVKLAHPGREVVCVTGEARSRCASRSCRPACSTTCRSRS